jgi:hypothetical protein
MTTNICYTSAFKFSGNVRADIYARVTKLFDRLDTLHKRCTLSVNIVTHIDQVDVGKSKKTVVKNENIWDLN